MTKKEQQQLMGEVTSLRLQLKRLKHTHNNLHKMYDEHVQATLLKGWAFCSYHRADSKLYQRLSRDIARLENMKNNKYCDDADIIKARRAIYETLNEKVLLIGFNTLNLSTREDAKQKVIVIEIVPKREDLPILSFYIREK